MSDIQAFTTTFADRAAAGRELASRLISLNLPPPFEVIALSSGGVPVGFEVARKLGAPLDWMDHLTHLQPTQDLASRLAPFSGKTIVLVDDGLATGLTARRACQHLRKQGAKRIIVAVPVCPPKARAEIGSAAERLVSLCEPLFFISVGQHYLNFAPFTQQQITRLLQKEIPLQKREPVTIRGPEANLQGVLCMPSPSFAKGLVIFAQVEGKSPSSPQIRAISEHFQNAGLATLIASLLTSAESESYEKTFDIPLLASRLRDATEWGGRQSRLRDLPIGYFGISTGAAAAIWAAAELGPRISAVVSSQGRPELAYARHRALTAPTLLIVGAADASAIESHRNALARMERTKLTVVDANEQDNPDRQVAALALDWFERHLRHGRDRRFAA